MMSFLKDLRKNIKRAFTFNDMRKENEVENLNKTAVEDNYKGFYEDLFIEYMGIMRRYVVDGYLANEHEIRVDYNNEVVALIEYLEHDNDKGHYLEINKVYVKEGLEQYELNNVLFEKFKEVYDKQHSELEIKFSAKSEPAKKAFEEEFKREKAEKQASINDLRKTSSKKDYRKHLGKEAILDLRSKTSVIQMYKEADLDEQDVQINVHESTTVDIKGQESEAITVDLSYNNDKAGYLMFTVHEDEQRLYIEHIEVWEVYQGLGLAQLMYKKFGEIYQEKYNGWIVEREFQNPAAEAAFTKAIEKGWVPEEALSEDHTKRGYDKEAAYWDLRKKPLGDNVIDLRKNKGEIGYNNMAPSGVQDGVLDLRNISKPKKEEIKTWEDLPESGIMNYKEGTIDYRQKVNSNSL